MPRGVNTQDEARIQGRNVVSANSSNIVAPGIVTDGLVLHLDAGNYESYPIAGTSWYDLSGYRNNGTLTNGPTYARDGGGAIDFDGTDDYGTIPASPSYQIGDGYTLFAWAKVSAQPPLFGQICGQFDEVPFAGSCFVIQPGSKVFYFLVGGFSASPQFNFISSTSTYDLGSWYFLTGTNLGTDCKFYINGRLDATYTQPGIATAPGSTVKFKFGRLYQARDEFYFNGSTSCFGFYNRALTPTEVAQNFNATRARFNI